jgi:hypothetical protein
VRGRPNTRLRLEWLEDRTAPAVVNWSGGTGGLGTNWNDPTNWVGNSLPGSLDDAVIGTSFSGITITATSDVSVHSVRSSAAIQVNGGIFSLGAAASVIDAGFTVLGGSFRLSGTTLNGVGTLTNDSDLVAVGSTVNTGLDNEGSCEVQQGTSTFNGAFTNGAAGTVTVLAGLSPFADATLKVANGFTNAGLITLTAGPNLVGLASTLTVASGTLTNAAGGTINVLAGTGGFRGINAQLINQGVVNINQALTLAANSAADQNSGTINVGSGGLTINQSGASSSFTNTGAINLNGGNLVVNQPNATSDFTNSGTITISSALLTITGGRFDPDSGSLNGLVQLNNVALGSGTLSSNASVTLSSVSELTGATLTNQGTLLFLATNLFNGDFTNDTTGSMQVRGFTSSTVGIVPGTLTLTHGFTNNGLVELASIGPSAPATLTVTGGTLTNAAGAVINALQTFSDPSFVNAQLDNQGTINVNSANGLTITHTKGSAALTSSGTINVNGGNLVLNQSGTTAVFVNTGLLNISNGRTLIVNGGEFDPDSGTINGAMTLNGVALGSGTLSGNAVVTLILGSEFGGKAQGNSRQILAVFRGFDAANRAGVSRGHEARRRG